MHSKLLVDVEESLDGPGASDFVEAQVALGAFTSRHVIQVMGLHRMAIYRFLFHRLQELLPETARIVHVQPMVAATNVRVHGSVLSVQGVLRIREGLLHAHAVEEVVVEAFGEQLRSQVLDSLGGLDDDHVLDS